MTQSTTQDYENLMEENRRLLYALLRCQQLFEEALPKFNWGASFLDANAIALLNEVPREVNEAVASRNLEALL